MKFQSMGRPRPSPKVMVDAIARFLEEGRSGLHSPHGVILSGILTYCVKNKVDFTLLHSSGFYYLMKGNVAVTAKDAEDVVRRLRAGTQTPGL